MEPIEESDLDLKHKLLGGTPEKKEEINSSEESTVGKVETPAAPETVVERKEGVAEKEAAYSKILSKVSSTTAVMHDDVSSDAKETSNEQDYESKVTKLVSLAEAKGIPHAVKVARHMEDNYLLDELHDKLLAEDLHDALIKKGLIREV